jgi:hypothetical protein
MNGKQLLLIIACICELIGAFGLAYPEPYRHGAISAVALGLLFYFISLMT